VVIDCDRHNPQADGVAAFDDLCDNLGGLPDGVPVVSTSSAGRHFFFKRPQGVEIKNWVGKLVGRFSDFERGRSGRGI
jgi:hypothetical protein